MKKQERVSAQVMSVRDDALDIDVQIPDLRQRESALRGEGRLLGFRKFVYWVYIVNYKPEEVTEVGKTGGNFMKIDV